MTLLPTLVSCPPNALPFSCKPAAEPALRFHADAPQQAARLATLVEVTSPDGVDETRWQGATSTPWRHVPDEPEAAGLIANLAFELQTPLATIVNDGGASTLVRQELARNLEILKDKRIVIWAFAERDLRFGMKGWARIALDE